MGVHASMLGEGIMCIDWWSSTYLLYVPVFPPYIKNNVDIDNNKKSRSHSGMTGQVLIQTPKILFSCLAVILIIFKNSVKCHQ